MSLLSSDPVTQLAFSVFENKGVYALLLGSGLSRGAEIPTGWEITLDLIRRVARAKGVSEQGDWAKWYHDETGDEPDYSALLAELASTADERRSILHSYIEPDEQERQDGKKVPTAAHRAIAALVGGGYIRVIITTNFDRLLENALREAGVEPTIIASTDALRGAEPIVHSTCYVLKLHGDYKDARIRNIDEELNKYPPKYNEILDRIFDEHGLIVCGWSGEWDTALRSALSRISNRRYPMWWMSRSDPKPLAQELIDSRKGKVITATDADSFFTGLQKKIETLEQTRQQSPESITLLVASAKRYLAKPEFRIQLDELVTQEANRLVEVLDGPEFPPHGPTDPPSLRSRVARYEAATEGLLRVCGVLGRWGDDSELSHVLDLVRALYANAEKVGSGNTFFLGLRSYPALLVVYAYGLGLTRSQRWLALHSFFSAKIAREYREPKRLVEVLFIDVWRADDAQAWNIIGNTERRRTPLDDYLVEKFKDWASSFTGLIADFETLYERFSMLGGLAYLERESEEQLQQILDAPSGSTPIPVGRLRWHSRGVEILTGEFQQAEFRQAICKAGFANGKPSFVDLFLKNAARWHSRMS